MLQLARSDWWREGSGGSDAAVRVPERTLVLHVENNAARNLALLERLVSPAQARISKPVHDRKTMQWVYALGELREGLDGVVALDLAAGGDVEGLARVLAVADVRAEDADALDDREEDIRAQVRLRGQADDHERAAHAQVVDRLRVRRAGGRGDDGGVRAEAVGGGDDVLDEVLGLAEVDPLLGAEARDELLLFSAGVCACRCESGGRPEATRI